MDWAVPQASVRILSAHQIVSVLAWCHQILLLDRFKYIDLDETFSTFLVIEGKAG